MKKLKRFRMFFVGLFMILFSFIFPFVPKDSYEIITFVYSVSLFATGVRYLSYYFSMARHMVGGKSVFYKGVIFMDIGMFTFTLIDIPPVYIIFYLLSVLLFSGVIDIMRALEAREMNAPSWRIKFLGGFMNIAVAVLAVVLAFFIQSMSVVVYVYSLGLFCSGCTKIVSAFRKTAIVYIQ